MMNIMKKVVSAIAFAVLLGVLTNPVLALPAPRDGLYQQCLELWAESKVGKVAMEDEDPKRVWAKSREKLRTTVKVCGQAVDIAQDTELSAKVLATISLAQGHILYILEGEAKKALRGYLEAIELISELDGPDSVALAEIYDEVGNLYTVEDEAGERRLDDSHVAFKRALEIRTGAFGAQDPRVVPSLDSLCGFHDVMADSDSVSRPGDHMAMAEKYCREAIDIAVTSDDRELIGEAFSHLMGILALQGRMEEYWELDARRIEVMKRFDGLSLNHHR